MHNLYLRRMIDYHYWAQKRVWDCVLALPEDHLYLDPKYSAGSIYSQWMHIYTVEWMWYHILRDDLPADQKAFPQIDRLETCAALRAAGDALESQVRSFVENATEEQLNRVVYQTVADPSQPCRAWEAILYVVTHAADHRAQILQLVHNLGRKTVSQDFITYVWETGDEK